jgi:hypothetical protein
MEWHHYAGSSGCSVFVGRGSRLPGERIGQATSACWALLFEEQDAIKLVYFDEKCLYNNHVTTNGTFDLIDLPNCIYVVSVDGPKAINDAIRGRGSSRR